MEREIAGLFSKTFSNLKVNAQSVTEIQKHLLRSSKERRAAKDKLASSKNITEVTVTSPFYDRNKICKAVNCHCPYHKRIREQAVVRRNQLKRRYNFNSTAQSPSKPAVVPKLNHRMSHKGLLRHNKENSMENSPNKVKITGKTKIQAYNKQFEDFLKEHSQLLLQRFFPGKISQHLVRSSVGEIFKYLYSHLNDDKQKIKAYIESIEKDRDISDFYVDRFIDIQRRVVDRQRKTQKLKTSISKKTVKIEPGEQGKAGQVNRNLTKSPTKLMEREIAGSRKINKVRSKRLVIQQLIKQVEDGDVPQTSVKDVTVLREDLFEENIQYLRKKIEIMDQSTLKEVREEIIVKMIKDLDIKYKLAEPQLEESFMKKKQTVVKLLETIDKLLKSEESESESNASEELIDRVSSYYSKASSQRKGSAIASNRKNSNFLPNLGKKSSFNHNYDENDQANDSSEPTPEPTRREGNKQSQGQETGNSIKKTTNKLKLAKYRRLSHQNFFHKTILNSQEDFDKIMPKFNIKNHQELDEKLAGLAVEFDEKLKKMKQIENKIAEYKLQGLLIDESDSLITAKRKARVFKKLLKEQIFTGDMKNQIKEYVGLIEQQALLKNRNWAYKKLKDMMSISQDDVDLFSENYEQKMDEIIKQIIHEIFPNRNKLVYYNLAKTEYAQKEVNFENHIFCLIEKDNINNKRKTKVFNVDRAKATHERKATTKIAPKIESGDLVQVGLSQRCESYLNFEETINFRASNAERNSYETNRQEPDKIISLIKQFNRF